MSDSDWGGLGDHYEYDPYDLNDNEDLNFGQFWRGKHGEIYEISKMSDRHLKNAIRMCELNAKTANFSDQEEKWDGWVEILEQELSSRVNPIRNSPYDRQQKINRGKNCNGKPLTKTIEQAIRKGLTGNQTMRCHCGTEYKAKMGDLKRGWALSCSKRCAAIRRDFGRNAAEIGWEQI